jgi:hypothetical protein
MSAARDGSNSGENDEKALSNHAFPSGQDHDRVDIMTDIFRAVPAPRRSSGAYPGGGTAWGQMPSRDTYATLNREVLTAGTPMPELALRAHTRLVSSHGSLPFGVSVRRRL